MARVCPELVLETPKPKNDGHDHGLPRHRMTQTRRIVIWLTLLALAALVSYVSFRGYFSPELLLNFANSFYC